MHQQSPSDTAPRRWRGRAKLAAGTLALTMGALGAGLVATALPAYADVLSSLLHDRYAIGFGRHRHRYTGLGRGVGVHQLHGHLHNGRRAGRLEQRLGDHHHLRPP